MKIVQITTCDQCPYFNHEYFSYQETCTWLERRIPENDIYEHDIPEDCPLEDGEQ